MNATAGDAAAGCPPPGGWFACRTRPRAEKKAHALLLDRGVECYLPLAAQLHRWSDRRRTVLVPLFTGYVFARAGDPVQILETPCVCDVVRFDGRPALVPDSEIQNIARFVLALGRKPRPSRTVAFRAGERVRITAGPFAGVQAVVVKGRDRRRVVVGLAAINAGFELDVPARALVLLEPVPEAESEPAPEAEPA